MHRRAIVVFAAFASLLPVSANAQKATVAISDDKGWTSYASLVETRDSSIGWATILNSNIGYDFNKHFSADVGVPVYLVQPNTSVSATNVTTGTSTSYNSLGDVYAGMNYRAGGALGYSGTIFGAAPTGSTAHGISTGRATVDWNNHFEHEVGHLTPFLEAGLGNSNTALNLSHGNGNPHAIGLLSYATLGVMSHFQGGTDIDLGKGFSVSVSGYDMSPLGNQKVYSRLFKKGQGSAVAVGKGNGKGVFTQNAVTSGTSGIAIDRGFTSGLDFAPSKRIEVGLEFTRSMTNAVNTVAFSIGYRVGHVVAKAPTK
jgi:hypothetical protein